VVSFNLTTVAVDRSAGGDLSIAGLLVSFNLTTGILNLTTGQFFPQRRDRHVTDANLSGDRSIRAVRAYLQCSQEGVALLSSGHGWLQIAGR